MQQDSLSLLHVQSGRTHCVTAKFSNSRLAVAHFDIAQIALQQALQQVYPKAWWQASPVIVMHQIHNNEGGLCGVEVRVLTDL